MELFAAIVAMLRCHPVRTLEAPYHAPIGHWTW